MNIWIALLICFFLLSSCWYKSDSLQNKDKNFQLLLDKSECKYEENISNKYPLISNLVYSPNWKSFAFVAKKENRKNIIVKDWIEIDEYDFVSNPMYIWNGDTFAFMVSSRKDRWYFMVVDGVEGDTYRFIDIISYSSSEDSIAYRVNKGGKFVIVKDWVEIDEYDNVSEPRYSKDGKIFAFIWEKNGKKILIKNGIEIHDYETIWWLKATKNDGWYIFRAEKDGEEVLVIDWIERNLKEYSSWKAAYFLDNGKYWDIFKEKKGDKWVVVQNGVESNEYDRIRESYHSLDGENFIFAAARGDKIIFIKNGIELQEYDYELISSITFSPNGESYAFTAKKWDKWVMIKDGIESNEYDGINYLTYSEKGDKFAFVVFENDDNWYIKNSYIIEQNDCSTY